MASICLRLDTRTNKNGMHPVRMRISHNNTSAYINTGVCVEQAYFDGSSLREPISRKAYMANIKNEALRELVSKFDKVVFELSYDEDTSLDNMSANDIRSFIVGEKTHERKKVVKACNSKREDFMDWFSMFGSERNSEKTRSSYAYVWRILYEYCKSKGRMHIYFDEIDYTFLVDLKKWIFDTGRGDSVRHQVEAYMHAAYREAQKRRMISRDLDPWEYYSIDQVSAPEEIEYTKINDIKRLLSVDLRGKNGEEWLETARDLIVMSWYLCGANLIDLYNMPPVKDGELVFVRHKLMSKKNRKPIHIRVEPEISELLNKYKGVDKALRFSDQIKNWYTFQRKINDRLDRLSDLSGVRVGFAPIRRSWATYASHIDIPDRVIDKSMGHVDNSILSKHYADYDWGKTAACNRRMIDFLWEGVERNSISI